MRIFRYRLPLARPLVTPAGTLQEREGYLLELTSEGNVGYGDMAPLPGFSPESADELPEALIEACRVLRRQFVTFDRWAASNKGTAAPAADFGWASAVLDLRGRMQQRFSSHVEIEVNGLLDPRADDRDRQLERLRENKFRVVKVKTGSQRPNEAVELAHFAAESLGGDVALRFDANRGWNLEEALTFCEGIRSLNVEYLEEPLRDPADAGELRMRTGVPLAADESLREGECPWADVWVIKPTLDAAYLPHLFDASDCGKRAVVSASFESGVGIAALARIAAQHDVSAQTACGLDTYHWLADDVLRLPLKFSGDRLDLANVAASMDTVDLSGLECMHDE